MSSHPLPHIEEVFSVFQLFQTEQARIISTYRPAQWAEQMKRAQEKFRLRLAELGLADHIDWTEKGK